MKELSLHNCRLDKRYDVRDSLGRGSYAEIFLARDTLASTDSPHCDVVIKALNVFLQDDLDSDLERTLVENFQNEAVALDLVRHPNIISRLGHGTARDLKGAVFHYLILEYLSGGNLQTHLRVGDVTTGQAFSFIEQICAGIRHAHLRGVIHRDIKPQNLLLSGDLTTIKIADFGVARFTTSESPITRVGTNIYAPPEHSPLSSGRTGELGPYTLTPSADIYSLAKTVYALLTGDTPRAFVNKQITSLPDSVREKRWADSLLAILETATASNPKQRHTSIDEFWGELEKVRSVATDSEQFEGASGSLPRAYISQGYTPEVPATPSFRSEPSVLVTEKSARNEIHIDNDASLPARINSSPPKKQATTRRVVTFFISFGVFTGLLYGTANYMRGRGVLPSFGTYFTAKNAVANTDIYLRPAPNIDNDPIGLVTKNSKVRIVNSQNNWYQVDVIEQGRTRPGQSGVARGWLNGKYLDLNNN